MKLMKINNTNINTCFGMNFKLSDETLSLISESTKLSVDELRSLPIDDAQKLMKERGAIKEPNKFVIWLSDCYRKLGENLGLLKKQRKIYTHDKIIYM